MSWSRLCATTKACGRFLEAQEAENGAVALERLSEGGIDGVVLDLNMPVMTGMEFLHEYRKREDIARLPIILCSTEGDIPMIAAALRLGASEFIQKPVTVEKLLEKLNSAGLLSGQECEVS